MIIYIIMLIISLFFSIYAQNTKTYPALRGTYHILAVLSALPFLIVTVFRYRVGTDWTFVYEPYFYYINHKIEKFNEIGFNLINRVIGWFTEDSWWMFAFVGAATIILFFIAIYDQSVHIPYSILLFFVINKYFTSLNQIRQMFAMAIFVYALKFVYQRKWKPYMFIVTIACTIHLSSVLYYFVYFLYGWKTTLKKSILLFTALVAALPIFKVVAPIIISFTRYSWYLDSSFNENNFYLMGFIVNAFFMGVHFLYLKRAADDIHFQFMSNMMLLSTVLLLFSADIPQVLRAAEAFSVVQIFSFPIISKMEKDENIKLWGIVLVVGIYSAKLWYDVYINQWHGVIPYHWVFFR